jgi:hypothetical protein
MTVTAAGSAVEQVGLVVPTISTPSTPYTLVIGDADNDVLLIQSAGTVTIPTNSSVAFPIGTQIMFIQETAGTVTFAGSAGVTVNATPGLKLRATYSSATLIKRNTDTWLLTGDLTA